VVELTIAPKSGPALHTHLREDELWYVVEGDFRFKAANQMLYASAGGLAFGPRGTPHCFQNVGDTPGKLLWLLLRRGSSVSSSREQKFRPAWQSSPPLRAGTGSSLWVHPRPSRTRSNRHRERACFGSAGAVDRHGESGADLTWISTPRPFTPEASTTVG
jgi:hypothetical protein